MSVSPFPRLTRVLQALGWLPQQTQKTTAKAKPTRKLERYDFADTGQLGELVEEIRKGELPQPKPSEAEPDFSSYSPSETARRLKEKLGVKSYMGEVPAPIVHRLHSSALQESLVAEIKEWPVIPRDTSPSATWGVVSGPSTSLVQSRPANPEEVSPPITGRRSSYVENYVIRETQEEMMHGTLPKTPPQPTIKDQWQTVERNQEPYVFWE